MSGATTVLGLLREPRWVRGLVLAVVVAVVCVVLGQWQWHRRQERLAANAPLRENYHAAPVDVGAELAPDGSDLPLADVWTPVRATGTYDTDATVLVRNRPRDEQTGYEVLVPLVLADGTALLVDRGWVPAGSDADRPDTVPAAPTGEVTVVARLRQYEQDRPGVQTPAGQVATIGRDSVREAAGAPELLGGYALLASESPSAPTGALTPEPDEDEGPHLAYTVQWYGFAVTALVVWVVAGRRELENRRVVAEDDPGPEGELDGPAPVAPEPVASRRTARLRPAGRRAGRPAGRGGPPAAGSDEEAEDAEIEAGSGRTGTSPGR